MVCRKYHHTNDTRREYADRVWQTHHSHSVNFTLLFIMPWVFEKLCEADTLVSLSYQSFNEIIQVPWTKLLSAGRSIRMVVIPSSFLWARPKYTWHLVVLLCTQKVANLSRTGRQIQLSWSMENKHSIQHSETIADWSHLANGKRFFKLLCGSHFHFFPIYSFQLNAI